MLDRIDSGRESDVDGILNDSDTKFVNDKPINKIVDDTYDILVSETNVQVASELGEPKRQDCEVLQKRKKYQLIYDIKWISRKTCHPRRKCTLQVRCMFNMNLAKFLYQLMYSWKL